MRKLAILILSILLYSELKAQTVDAHYINPQHINTGTYKFLRFGNSTEFTAGFMFNETSTTYGDGNDFSIFTYDNRDLTIRTGTGNFILFPSDGGKMGIGTTSPTELLDITGEGMRIGRTGFNYDTQGYINLFEGVNNHGVRLFLNGNSNKFILKTRLQNTDSDVLVIPYAGDLAGNVGIGTGTPNHKLDVAGRTKVGGISGTTALSNADDLIVESYSNGGISLLVPDSNDANFYLGNPADNAAAGMRWSNTSKTFTIGTLGTGTLRLLTGNFTHDQGIIIDTNGKVGIGTSTPQSKLAVNGQIRATEVKVLANINVPDYVFESDYKLRTLQETKEYISANKHLPEIPSAKEMETNGVELGDMNMRLLKKIEELTLYQIQLMEEMEVMKKELQELKK